MEQDVPGYAAEDEAAQAGLPARPDDDDAGASGACRCDDLVSRVGGPDLGHGVEPSAAESLAAASHAASADFAFGSVARR
jgi:hypothetical protein